MVDTERLRRLLQHAKDARAFLGRRAGDDRSGLLEDEVELAAVKWHFVVMLEATIDCAQHVCSSEGWGPPKDNADSMRVLARHGVLPAKLSARMEKAVGFRNLLVHQYAEVDDAKVVEHLDGLDDIDAFVAAVGALIS